MTATATRVGIAVVEHGGAYLVGTRDAAGPLAGYNEFPGGKCRDGESPRDAAARECLEETGLAVEPVELIENRAFDYQHARVDLHFWLCRPVDNGDVAETHQRFHWVPAENLASHNFPPANVAVLDRLISRSNVDRRQ